MLVSKASVYLITWKFIINLIFYFILILFTCTFMNFMVDRFNQIANLIGKLNFYKLIPYPMDNSLSGRRGPARQTSEKDVLCLHRLGRPSGVHSPDGV